MTLKQEDMNEAEREDISNVKIIFNKNYISTQPKRL